MHAYYIVIPFFQDDNPPLPRQRADTPSLHPLTVAMLQCLASGSNHHGAITSTIIAGIITAHHTCTITAPSLFSVLIFEERRLIQCKRTHGDTYLLHNDTHLSHDDTCLSNPCITRRIAVFIHHNRYPPLLIHTRVVGDLMHHLIHTRVAGDLVFEEEQQLHDVQVMPCVYGRS